MYCVIQFLQNSAMNVYVYPETTPLESHTRPLPLLLVTLLFCFTFPVSLLLYSLWVSSH